MGIEEKYLHAWREMRKDRGHEPPLNPPPPGGTSGEMDPWQQSVETRLGQLSADLRALLRYGVAAAVALAALVGGLYLYTNGKFDGVNNRFDGLNDRLHAVQIEQQKQADKLDIIIDRLPKPHR